MADRPRSSTGTCPWAAIRDSRAPAEAETRNRRRLQVHARPGRREHPARLACYAARERHLARFHAGAAVARWPQAKLLAAAGCVNWPDLNPLTRTNATPGPKSPSSGTSQVYAPRGTRLLAAADDRVEMVWTSLSDRRR